MDSTHLQFMVRQYCAANGLDESQLSLSPVNLRIEMEDVRESLDAVHILVNEEIDTDLYAVVNIDSEYGKLRTNPIHYRTLPPPERMVMLSGALTVKTSPAFRGQLYARPYTLHFIRLTQK